MGTLSMFRGDTKTATVTIQPLDSNGNQVLGSSGITGWQFWMTAKYDPGDADSAAVFQKGPSAWNVVTAGNATTAAVATVTIQPADTSGLPGHQITFSYDIQGVDTSGDVFTVDSGTLTVQPDVTITI